MRDGERDATKPRQGERNKGGRNSSDKMRASGVWKRNHMTQTAKEHLSVSAL